MATRLAVDKEDYLAGSALDIGRRIGADQHELFVVCDPAEALLQKLEHLRPEYIVLHDVGGGASRVVLRAVAEALRKPLQHLAVRRQGYGTTLATLAFVELPSARGRTPLRLYSTQGCAADETQRRQLADALLCHSRLGVLLVDTGASASSTEQEMRTLGDSLCDHDSRSRQLLCVPSSPRAASLLAQSALVQGARLNVLVGPVAASTAQAWAMIQEVWGQLRAGRQPSLGAVQPVSAPVAAPERPAASGWQNLVRECATVQGVVNCCIFEQASQRSLAHAGSRPGPAALAAHGAAMIDAAIAAATSFGLPHERPEVAVRLGQHHLLVCAVPEHPGLLLHAVIDASANSLDQARTALMRALHPGQPRRG